MRICLRTFLSSALSRMPPSASSGIRFSLDRLPVVVVASLHQRPFSGGCPNLGSAKSDELNAESEHFEAEHFEAEHFKAEQVKNRANTSTKFLIEQPRQITELDDDTLFLVCSAIGRDTIEPHIELRLAIATQLDARVAHLRTDTLLLCLKTLLRTEEWNGYGPAYRLLRQAKGIVWGSRASLNHVVKSFQEMAPKVSDELLLQLFEISVKLGISTTALLDVVLPQLLRRFSHREIQATTNDQKLFHRDSHRPVPCLTSPESVGMLLRAVEICQDARLLARHHAGLSNRKLGEVHEKLGAMLRSSLFVLFRWGANEWAWKSVVALLDEAEWRNAAPFIDPKHLVMLRGRARKTETFAEDAGYLSVRILHFLEEDPCDALKIIWGNLLLEMEEQDHKNNKGAIISTALTLILDCCPKRQASATTNTGKPLDQKERAEESVDNNKEEEGEEEEEQKRLDEEHQELKRLMHQLREQGFHPSNNGHTTKLHASSCQLTPSLATLLMLLKSQVPLASDLKLYRLFQLLMNLKPFVERPSFGNTPRSSSFSPSRIPLHFATQFSDVLMHDFHRRIQRANSFAHCERFNSNMIFCLIVESLSSIPTPHGFLKQNPSWETQLLGVHAPKLVKASATMDDVICLMGGVISLKKCVEQEQLSCKCLLVVLQQYRSVGMTSSSFLSLARCLPTLTTRNSKELAATCILLEHHLSTPEVTHPLTFLSFLKLLRPSLCSTLASHDAGSKLLTRSLQLLTTLICANSTVSQINPLIQVPTMQDASQGFALDISSLYLVHLFDGITIASILLEELQPPSSTTVGSRQTVIGCLGMLDGKVPPPSSSVFRLLKKFHPRRLTETVILSLPSPSRLIHLLEASRVLEKEKIARKRPVGVTPTHRQFMEMRRTRQTQHPSPMTMVPPEHQHPTPMTIVPPEHQHPSPMTIVPPEHQHPSPMTIIPPEHQHLSPMTIIPPEHQHLSPMTIIPPSKESRKKSGSKLNKQKL